MPIRASRIPVKSTSWNSPPEERAGEHQYAVAVKATCTRQLTGLAL